MDSSTVGEARRRASLLAGELEFDETGQGRVALVVSEAATNLIKHAGGGELILQGQGSDQGGNWLEILALDRGSGMIDVGRCMTDGYSTAGSLGTGLGAIGRLSDDSGIYSQSGEGTVVWARLDARPHPKAVRDEGPAIAAVCVPSPGETECGDDWAIIRRHGQSLVMIVDGLGHGPEAAEAAEAAVDVFRRRSSDEPVELIGAAHLALRSTRGAALAIARIDATLGQLQYTGVGNISGIIVDCRNGRTTSMISHNGTVGHVVRKIQAFEYPWSEDSLLIMHSDGLATRWDLNRYPGLSRRPPGLLAGILYRDHKRGRDDVTVVVGARRERRSVTHRSLLSLELQLEPDVVLARQRARQIAGLLGFNHLDQTRIATATSEIARNAFQYAGGGRVEFLVESGLKPALVIRIRERGPGIRDLQAILDGQYISSTGLGLGIVGAKRLVDRFSIESGQGAGATVSMAKVLPHRIAAPGPQELARISADLARHAPQGLLEELQLQNQELLNTLQELRDRQAELAQMHSRELDETNRGVVALYAELDDHTNALKRLSDLKSRFLSEMSHEFRSPLNSIRSLTSFLLGRERR